MALQGGRRPSGTGTGDRSVTPHLCEPVHCAEKIGCLVPSEGNIKCPGIESLVGVSQVDESAKIPADGFRQCDPCILGQKLRKPEDIVAMLPDVLSVDIRAFLGPCGEVENSAGLERYEQGLVDDRDAVNLAFCGLERLEIGIVEQDCRKADYVLVYRYPRVGRVFGQVEVHGPPRKELDHEGEARVGRTVESVEFPSAVAPFASLISTCVEKRLEGSSEFGVDHLDAEHHVDVPCRPEIETGCVKQQIASGATDDGVLTLMSRKVFANLVDSSYHGIPSNSRSAVMDTRSSR